MAIWAGEVAIASVGVSCQATHQLENHGALIGGLVGSRPKNMRTPFDWIVCPAQSVARMIGDWRFHPADPAELIEDEAPFWPDPPCWFWHDGVHLAAGDFLARQDHISENFAKLRGFERQIFILSNTQGNLDEFAKTLRHPLDFTIKDDDIDAVDAALKAQFRNPELWVVARKDRHQLDRHKGDPRVFEFEYEPSDWKGDYGQWAAALTRMLAPAG